MKKLMLLHGANLNLLGSRFPQHYGTLTLAALEQLVTHEVSRHGMETLCYQSNHEGKLIDILQENSKNCLGIIINPGAFTHYSYALHDALLDTGLPVIEVHLSDIKQREAWRRHSVIEPACIASISGKKEQGYLDAVEIIMGYRSAC